MYGCAFVPERGLGSGPGQCGWIIARDVRGRKKTDSFFKTQLDTRFLYSLLKSTTATNWATPTPATAQGTCATAGWVRHTSSELIPEKL